MPVDKKIINEDNIESLLNVLKNNKDVVKDLTESKILPSSYRLYLRSLSGIQDPIDENFFSKSELKQMKSSIGRSEIAKEIGDKNYLENFPKDTIGYSGKKFSVLDAFIDPTVNLEMTLGRSNYEKDKEGNYILKDKYDFNTKSANVLKESIDPDKLVDKDLLKASIEEYKKGEVDLAGLARVIGGINLGDQKKGIDVKINLGKIEDDEKKKIANKKLIKQQRLVREDQDELDRLEAYEKNPRLMGFADPQKIEQMKIISNLNESPYTISDFKDYYKQERDEKINNMNKEYGKYSPYFNSGVMSLKDIM
jgi:hypothetical protein